MLLVEIEVENSPFAAREARQQIANIEGFLPEALRADVTLLVSELVTNSYRHSGRPRGEPIGLRVEITGPTVRIEVTDRGAGSSPGIRDAYEEGGWGLRIVETVADRWGTAHDAAGTIVWFEMEAVT